MKWVLIILVILCTGCGTSKILTDGVKYERHAEFKRYLDSSFAGHAYRWSNTDGAKLVSSRTITDYYATDKGTQAFDRQVTGYFVARAKLVAGAFLLLAAISSALVGLVKWLRNNVTIKKNDNSSD
jgi:hypothetical protein